MTTAIPRDRGFTIVEMLLVVVVLVIVLGLMVNLARSVRVGYATDVTKDLLRQLDDAVGRYQARHGRPPDVTLLIPDETLPLEEATLRRNALRNNKEVVVTLRTDGELPTTLLSELPTTLYASGNLRDAWGTPIAFMPRLNRQIGMALRDRPFFVSAGPDRKFLTLEDNFYSYEGFVPSESWEQRSNDDSTEPATLPTSPTSATPGRTDSGVSS